MSMVRADAIEPGITVILNLYRRPEYLRAQLAAIRAQSVAPREVWLWVNAHESNRELDLDAYRFDRVFRNDVNWKFWGRFAAALLARTRYVALFDDDTIPGSRWLENCLTTMARRQGILGTAGVIYTRSAYDREGYRFGWTRPMADAVEVDFVGHAWFVEREWLKYFWMEPPGSWETGEDMHLSYTARKYGGIRTYCPPHPVDAPELHGSLRGHELGTDGRSGGAHDAEAFFAQRQQCFDYYRARGWRLRYRYLFPWLAYINSARAPLVLQRAHRAAKAMLRPHG